MSDTPRLQHRPVESETVETEHHQVLVAGETEHVTSLVVVDRFVDPVTLERELGHLRDHAKQASLPELLAGALLARGNRSAIEQVDEDRVDEQDVEVKDSEGTKYERQLTDGGDRDV